MFAFFFYQWKRGARHESTLSLTCYSFFPLFVDSLYSPLWSINRLLISLFKSDASIQGLNGFSCKSTTLSAPMRGHSLWTAMIRSAWIYIAGEWSDQKYPGVNWIIHTRSQVSSCAFTELNKQLFRFITLASIQAGICVCLHFVWLGDNWRLNWALHHLQLILLLMLLLQLLLTVLKARPVWTSVFIISISLSIISLMF